jgi:RimJ/RimL family protein N-acetyltransferase
LRIEFIVGIVHPENSASQRVLEKLGMRLVEHSHYFGMKVFRYIIERSTWEGMAKRD